MRMAPRDVLAVRNREQRARDERERAVRDMLARAHPRGTVVRSTETGERGVVVKVLRPGDLGVPGLDQVGDMIIRMGPGHEVHSNRYDVWLPVPLAEQTVEERVRAAAAGWPGVTWWHEGDGPRPESETLVFHLLLAMLPPGHILRDAPEWVDWPATHFEIAVEVARALDQRGGHL